MRETYKAQQQAEKKHVDRFTEPNAGQKSR